MKWRRDERSQERNDNNELGIISIEIIQTFEIIGVTINWHGSSVTGTFRELVQKDNFSWLNNINTKTS